ncbi:hypothetical protein [Saccharothrix luteola]|uniref:hypothetical protein n=1 Tax=Saccharothrix luteola TaxID=2893018 RepID=UPI001E4AA820|nr:hypothetical protein [Saccharothrix luteola]MCC8247713.1 hypothetical protein [Saccharothrix luteola]
MVNRRVFLGAASGAVVATAAGQLVAPATAHAAQGGWSRCRKCRSLFFPNVAAVSLCVGGGVHERDPFDGVVYKVLLEQDGPAEQVGWRSCAACQCLWWAGGFSGHCPGDPNGHRVNSRTVRASFAYVVEHDLGNPANWHHRGWRSCFKCTNIFLPAYGTIPVDNGRCMAAPGSGHDATNSFDYAVQVHSA